MKEYLHDQFGFFREDMAVRTGEKFRPVEIVQGTIVFDSKIEADKRAENRQRVEQWQRKVGTRVPTNPFPRKV